MAIKEKDLPVSGSYGPGVYVRTVSASGESQKTGFGDMKEALNPTVDSALSTSSTNAVQNKVITGAVNDLKEDLDKAIEDFAVPTQEAVDNWLDNHPEATTTVQDHSLTYNKLVNGTLGYVTPQMFGAKCDGITDDTNAFIDAISSSAIVYVPQGTYYLAQRLTIPSNTKLIGATIESTILNIPNGILISGRNSSIQNLYIKGNDTAYKSGIEFDSGVSFVNITDCTISRFGDGNGIIVTDYIWTCTFKNLRISLCKYGISFIGQSSTSFSLLFENIMTISCEKNMRLSATSALFESCNFGIETSFPSFDISNNSSITFIKTNFENDTIGSDNTNAVFNIGAQNVEFLGCSFSILMDSNTRYFNCTSSASTMVIKDPKVSYKTGNAFTDAHLFKNFPNSMKYNSIVFQNCDKWNLLNFDIYRNAYPYFQIDNRPMYFYNVSLELDRIPNGQLMWQTNTNTLCFFNGTNVVDFNGNTIL